MLIIIVLLMAAYSYNHHKPILVKNQLNDAEILFENGKTDEAIAVYEIYVKENQNDTEAKERLAIMYYQSSKYDQFISFTINDNLESATLFVMMANVYLDRNDLQKCEEYYDKALVVNPDNPQYYIDYAAYYQTQGNFNQAAVILERGIKIIPKNSQLLISAASVYLKIKDKEKARAYTNEVLVLEPDNLQAKAILNKI